LDVSNEPDVDAVYLTHCKSTWAKSPTAENRAELMAHVDVQHHVGDNYPWWVKLHLFTPLNGGDRGHVALDDATEIAMLPGMLRWAADVIERAS
jgi:hypothetical protein